MKPLRIVLVGIGGYGVNYVASLFDAPPDRQAQFAIAAAVDPNPSSCRRLGDLAARGTKVVPSLDAFYEAGGTADLAAISSPLQFHADQTCAALERGSHVICEKPLCATPDDARRMAEAQQRSGRHVAVGYQWSFSAAVQGLKADVLAGRFGRPLRLRTLVLWPRDEVYYHRNRWAGLQKDPAGRYVLDSPVSNACAHHLHNMLYVLGDAVDSSAAPAEVTAELYRAYPIENYDTAAVRCTTAGGAELLFIASHALAERNGPVFEYQFERGTVNYADGGHIVARFADGTTTDYGSPEIDRMRKLWHTIDLVRGDGRPLCGIAAATPQVQFVWAAQQSPGGVVGFPPDLIDARGEPGSRSLVVRGLAEALAGCYERFALPGEVGVPWAKTPAAVRVGR